MIGPDNTGQVDLPAQMGEVVAIRPCLRVGDLARTRPACALDRQFPENFLFGQAKTSIKNIQF